MFAMINQCAHSFTYYKITIYTVVVVVVTVAVLVSSFSIDCCVVVGCFRVDFVFVSVDFATTFEVDNFGVIDLLVGCAVVDLVGLIDCCVVVCLEKTGRGNFAANLPKSSKVILDFLYVCNS